MKDLFLFNGLEDSKKETIISELDNIFSFKKGDVIYSEKDFQNAIGIVLSGTAAAVSDNSEGIYMNSFSKGSVFGVAAIFGNNQTYVSKIFAKSDVKILFIEERQLKEIFDKFPLVSLNYISFLTDKIRFLNNKLNLISSSTADDTVYKYLLGVMDEQKNVNIPVSMTILAKMLGLGRATLYRSFDSLESNGKIKRENNIIKVI